MANVDPAGRVHIGAKHGPPDPQMSVAAMKYLLVRPAVPAPLDPNFSPAVLGKKKYLQMLADSPHILEWSLERADGAARGKLPVLPDGHPEQDASVHLTGVLIQEMLWQRSAFNLKLCGPKGLCELVKAAYSAGGKFNFEIITMPKVCGMADKPFEVSIVGSAAELATEKNTPVVCGKDASGCRLAFDLGKSDIKTVAVKDNEVIISQETEWDVTNEDPQYHWDKILGALKETAKSLPRIDAIGGSATGTVSGDNEATWCDIFPNVPPGPYKEKVVPIFKNLAKEFGDNLPLRVINDGEVTALAGMLMVKQGNLFGISMGSSEGGGFCDLDGNLLGWINEMCYIQLDLNPAAPYDPWTPHSGMSHMYLGQRSATRLATLGGIDLPDELKPWAPEMNSMKHEGHAKCLKAIQAAMKDPAKEPQARKIYETVGVYLGYALAQYSEHYPIDNALILGRCSTGEGGDVMLKKAAEVLAVEFPALGPIKFHTPDEHFKRVGQCIAAAALPKMA